MCWLIIMKLIKISSTKEIDQYIIVESDDLQDCMLAVERVYRERRTPKITGDNPKLTDPLLFTVYGDTEFHGYGSDGADILFTAEIVHPRFYDAVQCVLR